MGYEIDFLPVGEKSGDAIALRFGNLFGSRTDQTVVVVDAGFQESGQALVDHIRKYYGTSRVDIVVSTHPDADHASGLEIVLDQMEVGHLLMHLPWQHTHDIDRMFKDDRVTDRSVREALQRSLDSARRLEKLAKAKGIAIHEPFAGLHDRSGAFKIVGPSQAFYESLLPGYRATPEPKDAVGLVEKAIRAGMEVVGKIAESWNFETLKDDGETSAENNSSAVVLLTIDGTSALLTADAGIPALTEVADRLDAEAFDYNSLSFVQIPHHGSRRNVGPTILNRLVGPKRGEDKCVRTAFVSAAKDGGPKHPAKKVTNAFRRRGAHVHATQGVAKWHHRNAPDRGWSTSVALPFYDEVEE